MKAMAVPTITYFNYGSERESDLRRSRMYWFGMMLFTGAAGAASGITGLMLGVVASVTPPSRIVSVGVTLLVAASFPLLFLMAHCMDKIRDIEKAIRLEYCMRHGLKDEEC